ncbi:MAG: methylated-DNA--[protein]-cysteine S-methyltransferase [Sphaerochaetaceae bacterium]
MKKLYFIYDSPLGELLIAEREGRLTNLKTLSRVEPTFNGIFEETPLIKRTMQALNQYLDGERQEFDIPLAPEGTPFQMSVWQALLEIPYGETRSYKEIAIAINNPLSCRAVGMANHNNPISFIIPCHRVIGANGKLVGYGGGLDLKQKLLDLEMGKPFPK